MRLLVFGTSHAPLARVAPKARGLCFPRSSGARLLSSDAVHKAALEISSSETLSLGSPVLEENKKWSQKLWHRPSEFSTDNAPAVKPDLNSDPSIWLRDERKRIHARLSQDAHENLGLTFSKLRCTLFRDGKPSVGRADAEIKHRFLENLDRYCSLSTVRGFSALAIATARLSATLESDQAAFISGEYSLHGRKVGFKAKLSQPGPLAIIIRFRKLHRCKVRLTAADEENGIPCELSIGITGHGSETPRSSNAVTSTTVFAQDETRFLMDVANMVLTRMCSEMQFTSLENAACTLVEALQRVIQFRTPYLSLGSVALRVKAQEKPEYQHVIKTEACWHNLVDDVPADSNNRKRAVDVKVSKNTNGHNKTQSAQDEYGDRHEAGAEVEEVDAENQMGPKMLESERKPEYLITQHGSMRALTARYIRNYPGLGQTQFRFEWTDNRPLDFAGADLHRLQEVVETSVKTAGSSTLLSLWRLKQGIDISLKYPTFSTLRLSNIPADSMWRQSTLQTDLPPRHMHLTIAMKTIARSSESAASQLNIILPSMIFPGPSGGTIPSQWDPVDVRLRLDWEVSELQEWYDREVLDIAKHVYASAKESISLAISEKPCDSLEDIAQRCLHAAKTSTLLGKEYLKAAEVLVKPSTLGASGKARASTGDPSPREVFIALGSNMGNRIEAIENACLEVAADENMHILETSPLYETMPMYVEEQGRFVNGVCKIETTLSPIELLDKLQGIENKLGRVKTVDKGPRNIDLDILTYGTRKLQTERLTVPHRLMHEREFVLRPLCETSGSSVTVVTPSGMNLRAAAAFKGLPPSPTPMFPLTPLSPGHGNLRSQAPSRRTAIMSILNVTPDSFSDGGDNHTSDLDILRQTAASHIAAGASIIDIGGQSSRPNAPDITAEEEISRILPAIEAIKSLPEATNIAISVDTYRASVAEAAIQAGAHVINDISAGLLDPDMLSTIAKLRCTYIMMHMRGTPSTMQSETNTTYPTDGLISTIASELQSRLAAAQAAGIYRWRIILDPGIGFAKTVEQNAEILGRFEELRNWKGLATYPWLVGTSRKGFIGKLTGVEEAKDRVEGTAATVTAAVQGGAEIVRVHDVQEMSRVVKMADAMYRRG